MQLSTPLLLLGAALLWCVADATTTIDWTPGSDSFCTKKTIPGSWKE
jgi:hypothetical protein